MAVINNSTLKMAVMVNNQNSTNHYNQLKNLNKISNNNNKLTNCHQLDNHNNSKVNINSHNLRKGATGFCKVLSGARAMIRLSTIGTPVDLLLLVISSIAVDMLHHLLLTITAISSNNDS